jgi:hypothetical protein
MSSSVYQQIQQILQVLKKHAHSQSEILLPSRMKPRTLQEKFIGIAEGSEQEVAASLGTTVRSSSFQVLKSTVYKKLINGLFILNLGDKNGSTAYAVARYENSKALFAAKILSMLGQKDAAEYISRREFPESERFEFSDNAVEFLSILLNGAVVGGEITNYKELRRKHEKWLHAYYAENEYSAKLNDLRLLYTKRGADRPQEREHLLELAFRSSEAFNQTPTFKLGLTSFRLRTLIHQTTGEYEQCAAICSEAEQFIRSRKEFATAVRLAEFALKRLVCATHLRDTAMGESAAKVCFDAYKPGNFNWFLSMENYFLLQMAVLDFKKARAILSETSSQQEFNALDKFIQERWTLYEFYLLYAEGDLSKSNRLRHKRIVSLKDFLSYIPTYSSDKTGYNVSVLILHVLYLIETGDTRELAQRIDALENYRIRHLKRTNNQADLFIRLLAKMSQGPRNRRVIDDKTQNLAAELRASNERAPGLEGIQILPFDWLWNQILGSIPNA